MLPYRLLIDIDKTCSHPIYLQIVNGFIRQIQNGIVKPATKLPGSRKLAELLGVHRKTVVTAMEELYAQGWVELIPYKGTYVASSLPEVRSQKWSPKMINLTIPDKAGFDFEEIAPIKIPSILTQRLSFNDGYPDVRLAPIEEMATAYARNLRRHAGSSVLSYGNLYGQESLRAILSDEFNKTRGFRSRIDNILITRGSQMAIYLTINALIRKGEKVVVGETNYHIANRCFQMVGAEIFRIPVDKDGLVIDELERLCTQHSFKAIYVTSHHHHPTTVTLIPERRIQLLALAEKYRFMIIEDDYDYEYHYGNSPVLPLASADQQGLVVYIGSFSKLTAPVFRLGYVIAPKNVITELVKLRRVVDLQGDAVLELAFAEMMEDGIIRRYLKKALKQYRIRRNLFCELLQGKLADVVHFDVPQGGMAVWASFAEKVDLVELAKVAPKYGIYIGNGLIHNPPNQCLNSTRLGFAAMNEAEIEEAITVLEQVIRENFGDL
ncbi:MAG: PLP-dependent aminotransferase family protein [Chitinophagales bacterium]